MSFKVAETSNARRWCTLSTFCVCALGLMLFQPTQAAAQDFLRGTWRSSADDEFVLTIRDNVGETWRSQQNCKGKLTPLYASDKYAFFEESITEGRADKGGKCADGVITIIRAGDRLALGWFSFTDGNASSADLLLSKQQ
jgi:hypothetical protein